MKKLVSLILCLAMVLAWLPAGSPFAAAEDSAPFAGGSGTEEDPYLVSTLEQLKAVNSYPNDYFLQINDIQWTEGSFIGVQLFGGYDGGGHQITGYTEDQSLFWYNSGTIRNLGLTAPSFSAYETFFYPQNDGILVSSNTGRVENCYATDLSMTQIMHGGNVPSGQGTMNQSTGGLVGKNTGTISNCCVTGTVYGTCSFSVSGSGTKVIQGVGGIVGWNTETGRVENCYSACTVLAAGATQNYSGIICGLNDGTVSGCYSGTASAVGGGNGASSAEQLSSAQEMADQFNAGSGQPYWGVDGSGQPILNIQTLDILISHPSDTYDMPIDVTLGSKNGEAELYYAVLGGAEGKVPYSVPFRLTQDTELLVYSQLSEMVYRVDRYSYRNLRYPVRVDQLAGTYPQPIQVELYTEDEETTIYYTLNGTDPTDPTNPDRYTYTADAPVLITATTTILAVAAKDDVYGDVMNYMYVISPTVTADPGTGSYSEPIEVELDCALDGYEIRYTTDGSDPTGGTGIPYKGPITICKTTELKVAAGKSGGWGEVQTFSYQYPQVTITPHPEPGEHSDALSVSFTCSADYAQLYYQIDDGEKQAYQEPVGLIRTARITVYAQYGEQTLATEAFDYTLPEFTITAQPGTGRYSAIQSIVLSCNGAYRELYYTLDGSDPAENGVLYTGPFQLDHSATVSVCAKVFGQVAARASFVYTLDLPAVTADPLPGDRQAPLTVTLSIPENYQSDYDIYYTLDGSDPKLSGIKYTEGITIARPVTTVIRAAPRSKWIEDRWGTAGEFRYTFSTQTFKVEDMTITRRVDYEVALTVSNTLPEDRAVTFYAAAYQNGKLLGTAMEQVDLPRDTRQKEVTFQYPAEEPLPADALFKVFCLDSVTRAPCWEAVEYPVAEIPVLPVLDSITAQPAAVEGYEGDNISITLIAHYLNGKEDQEVIPDSYSVGDGAVARAGSTYVYLVGGGSTTVTYFYTEDGITRSAEVPVTARAQRYDLGLLADPTDKYLPQDAVPISTAQQLAEIGGSGSAGKTYYLTDDIQLTEEWTPIVNFQGTFDGRGHKISGLYVLAESENPQVGLFSSTSNATIRNVTVEIDARGVTAEYYDGFSPSYAGGLAGYATYTSFQNCAVTGGPVAAHGNASIAGGLAGYVPYEGAAQSIANCYVTCDVTANTYQASSSNTTMAGGLIGSFTGATSRTSISRCYATGAVSAGFWVESTNNSLGICAGGLIGNVRNAKISNCFAFGAVSAWHLENSTAALIAGGLVGYAGDTAVSVSYAHGNVTATAPASGVWRCSAYVGGLVGVSVSAAVTDSYRVSQSVTSTGMVTENGNQLGTEVASYYDDKESAYPKLDFTSTWQFTQGAFLGLPHLQYQE